MLDLNGYPYWYALWTKSRHEKHVRDQLAGQGIQSLLPLIKRLNQWKDRKKEVELPLFPGYCFARFAWKDHLIVLRASGIVRIIGSADQPQPIPDDEIQAIEKLMSVTLPYDSYPYLREGVRVRVIGGPLEGLEGILSRMDRQHRVVISVHLIQQAAAVEINLSNLVPI